MLFEELCRRGYAVVPVNHGAAEVMGRPCFARVQDIKPKVDGVLLMTSPTATEAVAKDCAEAVIGRVSMLSAGVRGGQPQSRGVLLGARDSGRAGSSVPSCFFRITDFTGFTGHSQDHRELSAPAPCTCWMRVQRKAPPKRSLDRAPNILKKFAILRKKFS